MSDLVVNALIAAAAAIIVGGLTEAGRRRAVKNDRDAKKDENAIGQSAETRENYKALYDRQDKLLSTLGDRVDDLERRHDVAVRVIKDQREQIVSLGGHPAPLPAELEIS